MRMAELSAESGVPVATIKYYLREGLLPPGERTSPNQARYGTEHIQRLKLVRALLDVGGLSVARVRDVLHGIEQHADLHGVLGVTQHGLALRQVPLDAPSTESAQALLEQVATERGWTLRPGNPVVDAAINTLGAFIELGRTELLDKLSDYARLADEIARLDLDGVRSMGDPQTVIEAAVVGTVLGDTLFAALRRLAQERASATHFRDRPS